MDITVDSSDINKFKDALDLAISESGVKLLARKLVVRATATMKASIVANTPTKTGALRSSIHGITVGLESRLYTDSPIAGILEDGAAPHSIFPVSKKALYWKGAAHPVAWVNHPGVKATHFFTKGAEEALPGIELEGKIFLDQLNEMFKI